MLLRLLFLVASATACSVMADRGTLLKQLEATVEPALLHATLVEFGASEQVWQQAGVLRSAHVTADLDAGTLSLGHLASGPPAGDVGLNEAAVTDAYSYALDGASGTFTITSTASTSTTIATPGTVVAWFVSEALGIAYVLHERPSDAQQRVLMAPLGCGSNCTVTDVQLGGGNNYFDTWSGLPAVLVDDVAQIARIPIPCCMCVSHASYRFDAAGLHPRSALDVAFASFAVDTRVGAIHVAGQQWETVYQPAYSDTFLAATLTTTGIGAAANASALSFPAANLTALLDRAYAPSAPPTPPAEPMKPPSHPTLVPAGHPDRPPSPSPPPPSPSPSPPPPSPLPSPPPPPSPPPSPPSPAGPDGLGGSDAAISASSDGGPGLTVGLGVGLGIVALAAVLGVGLVLHRRRRARVGRAASGAAEMPTLESSVARPAEYKPPIRLP